MITLFYVFLIYSCHPDDILFYLGLAAPLAVSVLLQFLLLLANSVVVLCHKGQYYDHNNSPYIIRLGCVNIIFAIGWSFGFAQVFVSDELMQVIFKSLFIVFGSMLGVYVLVIYGLLNSAAYKAWGNWLRCQKEEKKFMYDVSEMNNRVPVKNGKQKVPVLEFRETLYGPEADFRSPSGANDNHFRLTDNEIEKEDTFMETQEIKFSSNESSQTSSQSSVGYPVATTPQLNMDMLNEIDQTFHFDLSLSIDQPDSDEETAL